VSQLWSGPDVVGRLWSGMQVSASFQIIIGLWLESGPHVVDWLASGMRVNFLD